MRISLKEWRQNEGLKSEYALYERLQDIVSNSICPALCDEGCEVEPDGECEHGCPSVLIAAGLI